MTRSGGGGGGGGTGSPSASAPIPCSSTGIAVDSSDNYYVSYNNGSNQLRFATKSGGSWSAENVGSIEWGYYNKIDIYESGGNVNAYTSSGWRQKVKSKNYIGKKTIGQTQGAAYDASEINNAAIMNYKDGLMRSRDSVSTKQINRTKESTHLMRIFKRAIDVFVE